MVQARGDHDDGYRDPREALRARKHALKDQLAQTDEELRALAGACLDVRTLQSQSEEGVTRPAQRSGVA